MVESDRYATLHAMAKAPKEPVSVELVPVPAIEKRILMVRERQVMLDEDLAELYGVETRRLMSKSSETSGAFHPTSCSSSLRKRRPL